MEITEKERLMLVKKKEEICGLTLWILGNVNEPRNSVQIKKNITMILSLLSTIASYSSPKDFDLNIITQFAEHVFARLRVHPDKRSQVMVQQIELFCNVVNSIRFDFTNKKGIKIVLPKNLNLGFITNK